MSKATREYKRKIVTSRAIQDLKKQIGRLKQKKEEYALKAKEAKLKGVSSSYSVARSGLKATLMQLKKLEVMLLNMEIVLQQRDFAGLSGSFLRGIQVASKELQKGIGKMNFSKTAAVFRKAFISVGIADEELQTLLDETEGTFETMTDSSLDKELDAIIGIEAAYEEEMLDRKLEQIRATEKSYELKKTPLVALQQAPSPERINNIEKESVSRKPAEAKIATQPADLQGEALRPISWDDFQGQPELKKKVQESINAAKKRKEPLKHILLYGPPGLGKTTVARIIAAEMGAQLHEVHGLNIKNVNDVANQLKRLKEGDILFIDEIHCVSQKAQEALYMALEDFKFTFSDGRKLITKSTPRFTLIGATTHAGRLNKPFLDRISNQLILQRYPNEEIKRIIINIFNNLKFYIDDKTAMMLAERCRGVPRIARGHCERLADKALNKDLKIITEEIMQEYFEDTKLDYLGLTETDIKLLENLIKLYNGGPAGLTTLANSIGVNEEEITGKIEPYLNYLGMLNTVPGGRVATQKAYEHLGYEREEKIEKTQVHSSDQNDSGNSDYINIENEEEESNTEKRKYINFAEQDVAEILAGLGEEYTVYNNSLLRKNDGSTLEIDHLVVSRFGIFVIETKNHSGAIKGYQHSEYFTQKRKGEVKYIYNPILQNAGHIKALTDMLGNYPIYSIIVFSDKAELDIDSTTFVCNVNQLLGYFEDRKETVISEEDLTSIVSALRGAIITDKKIINEHIDAIRARKSTKRAIKRQGICPLCKTNMIGIEGENGLTLQCPNCKYTI